MKRTLKLLRILLVGLTLISTLLLTNSNVHAASNSEAFSRVSKSDADSSQPPMPPLFLPLVLRMDQSERMDQPDLVNPSRGYYRWRSQEIVPNGEPALDAYDRYFWSDIETSKGDYDFSIIDTAIAEAVARGQKFGFRIRAMKDSSSGGMYIPSYLKDCGWYNSDTFIPDWNSGCFLDNAENMIRVLGKRYDNDPRIAWIDIGMYGTWGEWALSDSIYNKAPSGIDPATNESLIRIVDMHLNAFPTVRKVMLAKTNAYAVEHALSASDQVGWRVDCLGKPKYFDFESNPRYDVSWPLLKNRWKTAPVIVEFCSIESSGMDLTYQTAEEQVLQWHISLVSNGNTENWDKLNQEQKENLISLGKKAGYRYQVNDVSLPDSLVPGQSFDITAHWQNLGVAPHYERVVVKYQFYDPTTGSIVWEGESGVDLRAILPDEAHNQVDSMALPDSLPAGTYSLRLLVVDPAGFRRPLRLAISGLQPDGSYYLRDITVP